MAEHLHFGDAARALRTAQPSLSQQIRRLEAEVGVALFERDRHSVHLTPAGEYFLRDARDVIARADQSITTAREVASGRIGRLRVACTFGSFNSRLAAQLASFSRQNPGIAIDLQSLSGTDAIAGLFHETVDIAVAPALPAPESRASGLLQRPFAEHRLMLVGVDQFSAVGDVTFRNVHDRHLLFPARDAEGPLHAAIRSAFGGSRLSLSSIQEVRDAPSLIGLAAAGFGIGIVPSCWQTYGLPGATFVPANSPLTVSYAFHYRTDVGNVVLETFVDSLGP